MGQHLDKVARGAYDAIVYKEGSEVVAEDSNGRKITSGVAGTDDALFLSTVYSTCSRVFLCDGSYAIGSSIIPPQNSSLVCQSNDKTILTFSAASQILVSNDGFRLVNGYITGDSTKNIIEIKSNDVELHDTVLRDVGEGSGICIWVNPGAGNSSQDLIFDHVRIINPKRSGFFHAHVGSISNVKYLGCEAVDCGRLRTIPGWGTGFEISEGSTVSDVQYIGCVADGCEEAGFATEFIATVNNVILTNCIANNNCTKLVPELGCGFMVTSGTTMSGCHSTYNKNGIMVGTSGASTNPINIELSTQYNTYSSVYLTTGVTNMRLKALSEHDYISLFMNGSVTDSEIDIISYSALDYAILKNDSVYCDGVELRATIHNPIGHSGISTDIEYFTRSQLHVEYFTEYNNGSHLRFGNITHSHIYCDCHSLYETVAIGSAIIIVGDMHYSDIMGIVDGFRTTFNLSSSVGPFTIHDIIVQNNVAYFVYCNSAAAGTTVLHTPSIILKNSTWSIYDTGNVLRYASNFGSSTGTGSEQTIAHGLAAIPTGCKAWIKYLVGTRYITEMVPFDATNIYPTVETGVAYEWRIE